MAATYNILIMGASYGSLLASKLLFGGHSVKLVCLPAEADLINSEGFRVRLPIRGRKDPIEIDSRKLPDAVAKSKVPCMSIMNMPPLPYIKRIPGLNTDELLAAYTDPSVWNSF